MNNDAVIYLIKQFKDKTGVLIDHLKKQRNIKIYHRSPLSVPFSTRKKIAFIGKKYKVNYFLYYKYVQ